MKRKSIISLFVILMGFGVSTTSCEDMLTPDMDRYAENFTGRDTVNFYFGILRNLQGVIEQNVLLGEVRGDLVATTQYTSDSISDLFNFKKVEDGENALLNRAAYYKVINQCNFYLDRVDTMAMKRNIYYMRKECAQVELIRAWTYMQLVQNYGRVPFISVPVDNANTGWETNPAEGWIDADNILDSDKLGASVLQALTYERTYGLPDYYSFNTGAATFSHRQTIFPADLVLGDLYLLRGRSGDYEKAAQHYYEYLSEYPTNMGTTAMASYNTFERDNDFSYMPNPSKWLDVFKASHSTETMDVRTILPSAANASFGKVLTRLPEIYGFKVSSSTSTSEGSEEGTTQSSGSISLTADEELRQLQPSTGYEAMCLLYPYRHYEFGGAVDATGTAIATEVHYGEVGDARFHGAAPYYRTEDSKLRFISKFSIPGIVSTDGEAYNPAFTYQIPVYRYTQVLLRYAEAINRAGFPRYAFSILCDGLKGDTEMPRVMTDSFVNVNDVDSTMQIFPYLEELAEGYAQLSVDEVRRAEGIEWLNFASTDWENHKVNGVHERGFGSSNKIDSLYTYENVVLKRVAEEKARVQGSGDVEAIYCRLLNEAAEEGSEGEGEGEGEGEETEIDRSEYTILPAADPEAANVDEINAVETLIAEEMAYELAFEGFRFYDLTRIARHKNNDSSLAANAGSEWMAWIISRRGLGLKPYEQPEVKDNGIYTLLLDPTNWYLMSPIY